MNFTYLQQPPRKFTFQQPKLKEWTEKWCKGKVLNLFAGMTRLNVDEVRVDINPEMDCDFCIDALDFVSQYDGDSFDTIILDPPYSLRKSMTKYKGAKVSGFKRIKDILPEIVSENGRVISFGYDTVGMAKVRGFRKVAICLVCHGGAHHDTVCLVEEKI